MPAVRSISIDDNLPSASVGAFDEGDLGLAGFVATVTPMFLVAT
jgi:hypothetical protein